MYDYYDDYGYDDLSVDMYIEEHQILKGEQRERNMNVHWREKSE